MDAKFLKKLIENHARVILPEFGAFLVKDDGTGIFKPQNLTFSPFLRYNDGMVEDELATTKKVSKDQAKDMLANFVDDVRSELKTKNVFVIEDIGSLFIDTRGSIQFTASPLNPKIVNEKFVEEKRELPKEVEPEAIPENVKGKELPIDKTPLADKPREDLVPEIDNKAEEGKPEQIKSKEVKPVSKVIPPISKQPIKPKPEVSKKTDETQEKSLRPTPPTNPKLEQSYHKKDTGSGTGKAVAYGTLIGIAFVVLFATGWHIYSTGIFSRNIDTPAPPPELISSIETTATPSKPKETEGKFEEEFKKLSVEMDKAYADPTQDQERPIPTRITPSEPKDQDKISIPTQREGLFHIIAGSFRNAEYAEKFSYDMRASGFNSKVIAQPTGMHAVALGSFLTREQAVDSMNRWKRQYPNIWILNQ